MLNFNKLFEITFELCYVTHLILDRFLVSIWIFKYTKPLGILPHIPITSTLTRRPCHCFFCGPENTLFFYPHLKHLDDSARTCIGKSKNSSKSLIRWSLGLSEDQKLLKMETDFAVGILSTKTVTQTFPLPTLQHQLFILLSTIEWNPLLAWNPCICNNWLNFCFN